MGLLPPQKMIPAENSSHLKAIGESVVIFSINLHLFFPDEILYIGNVQLLNAELETHIDITFSMHVLLLLYVEKYPRIFLLVHTYYH